MLPEGLKVLISHYFSVSSSKPSTIEPISGSLLIGCQLIVCCGTGHLPTVPNQYRIQKLRRMRLLRSILAFWRIYGEARRPKTGQSAW